MLDISKIKVPKGFDEIHALFMSYLELNDSKKPVAVNKWITVDNFEIYMRLGTRYVGTNQEASLVAQIASINTTLSGQGRFTVFLPVFEDYCKQLNIEYTMMESVMDVRFCNFLKKQGYELQDYNLVSNMFKNLCD